MAYTFKRWRRLGMLSALETNYSEDALPQAADAIVGANVQFTPINAQEVTRDLMLPYLGNQGIQLAGIYATVEYDIEIAGSGTAGTPPRYATDLRAAGFAETITAGTKVDYTLIEDDVESCSHYIIIDKVQHILVGCQTNIAPSLTPSGIPRYHVTKTGLLGTITDIDAMPVINRAPWITPVMVNKANTVMTLHAWNAIAESVSLDLGNVVTPRFLIGDERILISDRSSTGTAVVQATSLSEINWFEKALSRTPGALSIVHGTTPGNIVEITAPAVEIGKPTQGNTNGIVNYSLPLGLTPVNGMDELKLTIR